MKAFKKLSSVLKKVAGRSSGQITVPRRGGGSRKKYRFLNFKRNQFSSEIGKIKKIYKFSPITNTYFGVVIYSTGYITAIILAEGSYENQFVFNQFQKRLYKHIFHRNFSSTTRLSNTPPGSILYNIEFFPHKGGQVNRSAGTSSIILKSIEGSSYSRLKLKSGELRLFHKNCLASIGIASNTTFFLKKLKKAGDSRHLGKRPRVRPSAMNPVDHPMGGRTKGGIQAQNKNALKVTTSTRNNIKSDFFILIGHRKNKFKKRKN